MGLFHHESEEAQAHSQVTGQDSHKAKITHELIAAAASYEAAKAYEKHCAEHGKPANHAQATELIAGFAGAFVDRIAETKGLDFVDKERAQHQAKQKTEAALSKSGEY